MDSFKKNVKFMIFTTFLIKLFGLGYKILFARFFNLEILRTISLLSPIISLSLVLSSMSIPTIVNKRVSNNLSNKTYYNRKFISTAVRITFISSTIIALIFIILSYFIANYIYKNKLLIIPIIITSPLLYFSNFSGIMKSYLEAHNNFKHPVISNLIEQLVKIGWLFLVIIFFKQLSNKYLIILISLSLLLCEISSNIYLLFKVKKMTSLKLVKTNLKDTKEILKPSFYLTLFSLVLTISSFLEPIIYYTFSNHVLINLNETSLIYTSLHSFVLPIIQIASFLTYVLVKILFPKMSRTKNSKEISYYLKLSFYILLFLNIILFNLSIFESDTLINLIYHKNIGGDILKMLAPITLLTFISPILTMILQSQGYEKILLKNIIISVILSLLSLIILSLIQYTTLYSIIYSLIIKEFIYMLLNLIIFLKYYRLNIKFRNILSIILIFILSFIIYSFINNLNPLLRIVLIIIYSIILYLPLFMIELRSKFD